MDRMNEFQLSHREAIEKMMATGEYNPLSHRETIEGMCLSDEGRVSASMPIAGGEPEVWTQPIGESWPPGSYGISIHGETPRVARFR